MQQIKMSIILLAATAIIFVPTDGIAASTQDASSVRTTPAVCTFLCFDLYEDGFRVGHDVDLVTAIKFCYGVTSPSPFPISLIEVGQMIRCDPYQGHRRWVVRTK
jgi:hypothetical protein